MIRLRDVTAEAELKTRVSVRRRGRVAHWSEGADDFFEDAVAEVLGDLRGVLVRQSLMPGDRVAVELVDREGRTLREWRGTAR